MIGVAIQAGRRLVFACGLIDDEGSLGAVGIVAYCEWMGAIVDDHAD